MTDQKTFPSIDAPPHPVDMPSAANQNTVYQNSPPAAPPSQSLPDNVAAPVPLNKPSLGFLNKLPSKKTLLLIFGGLFC